MKNVRKAILKAIAEANKVVDELDAERSALIVGDNNGMTELEFDFKLECIDSERALARRIVSELYDVLGNTPA